MIASAALRFSVLLSLALAACRTKPSPVAVPAPAATPTPASRATAPQVQMRAVRGGAAMNVPVVALADIKLLVPAVESRATCHVSENTPIPGVARMMSLRFDSTVVGGRNMSLGLAADGTPVSYSESRGDITRRAGDLDRPRTKMTTISISIPQRRGTVSNTENGVATPVRVQDDSIMTSKVLGNPSAMMARIRQACAGVKPQPAVLAPGSAVIPAGPMSATNGAVSVKRLSSDPESFAPAFAAVTIGGVCLDVPAAMPAPVTRMLVERFFVQGIPVRELSLSLDAAGRPVTYQDLRSGNLQAPGGPAVTAYTSIVLDFARQTAQLSNVSADQQRAVANAPLQAAMDAKSLGVPAAIMDGLRERCGAKR